MDQLWGRLYQEVKFEQGLEGPQASPDAWRRGLFGEAEESGFQPASGTASSEMVKTQKSGSQNWCSEEKRACFIVYLINCQLLNFYSYLSYIRTSSYLQKIPEELGWVPWFRCGLSVSPRCLCGP